MRTTTDRLPLTARRRRMLEDLQLRGMSARTQEMDVRAVRHLAQHYRKPPDQITEDELRDYFLHITHVRQWSRAACTIALGGITCFDAHTLTREWTTLRFVRPPTDKRVPTVLSRDAVHRVLPHVHLSRSRVCLQTIYACGLRVGEALTLQVRDVDRARLVLHLRHGTGGTDRDVPLPLTTRELLRTSGKTHRHAGWIFPAPGRGGLPRATAHQPMSRCHVPDAVAAAVKQSGLHTRASVHTLRPSYATPLLEAGVNLRLLPEYLGHGSPTTTAVSTPVTTSAHDTAVQWLHQLLADLAGGDRPCSHEPRSSAATAPPLGPTLATACPPAS